VKPVTTTDWRAAMDGPQHFWTCDDTAERLTHDCLSDAVEEYIDGLFVPARGLEAFLREKVSPLTIFGYSRAKVTDERLADLANDLADHLQERLDDGYDDWSDPDGQHQVIDDTGKAALAERFFAVLRDERAHIEPWGCEVTAKVTVEGDELVAMVRELCPYWFEEGPLTAPGR
jgi:hypothetical protein